MQEEQETTTVKTEEAQSESVTETRYPQNTNLHPLDEHPSDAEVEAKKQAELDAERAEHQRRTAGGDPVV